MTDGVAAYTNPSWFQRTISTLAINSHFSDFLGAVYVVVTSLVLLNIHLEGADIPLLRFIISIACF